MHLSTFSRQNERESRATSANYKNFNRLRGTERRGFTPQPSKADLFGKLRWFLSFEAFQSENLSLSFSWRWRGGGIWASWLQYWKRRRWMQRPGANWQRLSGGWWIIDGIWSGTRVSSKGRKRRCLPRGQVELRRKVEWRSVMQRRYNGRWGLRDRGIPSFLRIDERAISRVRLRRRSRKKVSRRWDIHDSGVSIREAKH